MNCWQPASTDDGLPAVTALKLTTYIDVGECRAQHASRKRLYNVRPHSDSKRLKPAPELLATLQRLTINKRNSEEEQPDEESPAKRRSPDRHDLPLQFKFDMPSPHQTALGLTGCTMTMENGSKAHLTWQQPEDNSKQLVKHKSQYEVFIQLAAQCFESKQSLFVASQTGTIWKASLRHNGSTAPEICVEEVDVPDASSVRIEFLVGSAMDQ